MGLFEKSTLAAGGLIASGIGTAILLAPRSFHAGYGILLPADPSILSEVRAPGALLIAIGTLLCASAFRAVLAGPALAMGAILYLAYGAGRIVSIALDGWPNDGLIVAAILELALGGMFAFALLRRRREGVPAMAGRLIA